MMPLDRERWLAEADAFVRRFAKRAEALDQHPGDLADDALAPEPWTDPDQPDERLDTAYRSGIVPPDERDVSDDGWCSFTELRARGRMLAKSISPGGIRDYDNAKRFDLTAVPVDGIDHLAEDLERLLHQPDRAIVRGGIADLGRCRGVRRLLHPDGEDAASLIEVPRRWVALDFDSVPLPPEIAIADLAACGRVAIAALPMEFRAARCVVTATAGHSFKPGARLRTWYWLDRRVTGAELKRWLADVPVDHVLFSPAQLTYTAAPVFEGIRDPLPTRIAVLPGNGQVTVPPLPEPEPAPPPKPVRPAVGLSRFGEVALNNARRRIVEAREGERDRTINSAAYGIGRLAGAGAIPRDFALEVLHDAAERIPGYNPRRDANKVNRSFANGLLNPREQVNG